jgi:hypothetical protein
MNWPTCPACRAERVAEKTCPECGSTLDRLTGPDGYMMMPSAEMQNRGCTGRVILVKQMRVIYTCPKCEHCE